MLDKNAGKPANPEMLADIPLVISRYYTARPDPDIPAQRVKFGTSGHRGNSLKDSFTESHILAIVQAICDYRHEFGAAGPLFLGKDTHALSTPAHETALSVLAANGVVTYIAPAPGFTPTPVISRSIIRYNKRARKCAASLADGIVITPSHNPPEDGGIKYNATHGGPSAENMTELIAERANKYLEDGCRNVKSMPVRSARASEYIRVYDYRAEYVHDLDAIIDFKAIRGAHLRLGADALGGAGLAYWSQIAQVYGLDITPMNDIPDPTFRFMCLDHDGRIRMDCSSQYAMASLVAIKDRFDLAFANDPDFDRHGIICPGTGLMNPNHYLAVAIDYLFRTRTQWPENTGIGKTLVSSMMIDKCADALGRRLCEVPVGFKWFVPGLTDGTIGFGGEESAGASFLMRDGAVWTTDKDGIIMALLAAEITAATGNTPAQIYADMEKRFGVSFYSRIDSPATPPQKAKLAAITPDDVHLPDLAGDAVTAVLTNAPGNNAPIGGLKLCAGRSWAAVRPSGTEDICKVYAESFLGVEHLHKVLAAASSIIATL